MSYYEYLTNQEDMPSGNFLTRSNLAPIQTRLKEVIAPDEEPVSLAEAKLWIRQDEDVGGIEDILISSLIKSARLVAERYTRSVFVARTMLLTRDRTPNGTLDIFLPPLDEVEEINVYLLDNTKQLVPTTTYYIDDSSTKLPARVILNIGQVWPTSLRAIANFEIRYTCGYGNAAAVPEPIKNAIKIIVDRWYEDREMNSKQEMPQDAKTLLADYQIIKL